MMENKPFRLGLVVGRFQTLHTGHEDMIRKAIALCDRVGLFVGSSQESGTFKNPFSYELRREMLNDVFGSNVCVYPLPDIGVGNNAKWGDYVLGQVAERFGRLPDLVVSGKEERRLDWFDSIAGNGISELYVPKSIEMSASQMRQFFAEDDFEKWKSYTNPKLWPRYRQLRQIALASQGNLETKSI